MANFVITALVAAFGMFYTAEGQTAKDIRSQLFEPEMTDNEFMLVPEESDVHKAGYGTITSVTQAFSIPFTEYGKITFSGHKIELGEFKIDVLITPDELRHSWAAFLLSIDIEEKKNWPIINWAIQQMIIPQSKEDYETEIAWYGWKSDGTYAASPTVNGATFVRQLKSSATANPANAAMDGIWIHMLKNISRINVFTTGAVGTDAVAWCTKVETFWDSVPMKLRSKIDFCYMSEANAILYKRGRRAKYNTNYLQEEDLTSIDGCNVKVKWLRSMDGSDKIWGTPKQNRIRPTKKDNSGRFDVQAQDRSVKLLTDWKKAIGFAVPEFVVTNDLENTITAGVITARYTEAA